jgi:hypothetical protein
MLRQQRTASERGLKKLLADLSFNKDALQPVIAENRCGSQRVKAFVEHLKKQYAFPERRLPADEDVPFP